MNPTLAQIYGMDKVASEEDEFLSQISGADLLELMNEGDGLDKMAGDGSFEFYDNAGRIMAHAYSDEMDKVAGVDDYLDIDLDSISGDELMELMDAGYEFDKTAGAGSRSASKGIRGYYDSASHRAGGYMRRVGNSVVGTRPGGYALDMDRRKFKSQKQRLAFLRNVGIGTSVGAAGVAGGAAYGGHRMYKNRK